MEHRSRLLLSGLSALIGLILLSGIYTVQGLGSTTSIQGGAIAVTQVVMPIQANVQIGGTGGTPQTISVSGCLASPLSFVGSGTTNINVNPVCSFTLSLPTGYAWCPYTTGACSGALTTSTITITSCALGTGTCPITQLSYGQIGACQTFITVQLSATYGSFTLGGQSSSQGSVSLCAGTAISAVASPNAGYVFSGWTFNGLGSGVAIACWTCATTTFTVPLSASASTYTLVAIFVPSGGSGGCGPIFGLTCSQFLGLFFFVGAAVAYPRKKEG